MDERTAELAGRLEYFRLRTEQDLEGIKLRLDKLWDFRIFLLGASITVSMICSTLITLASIYFGAR